MALDEDALAAAVQGELLGPLKVRTEAGEYQSRPALDLIALASFQLGLEARKKSRRGIMFTVLNPSGAVGRERSSGGGATSV